MGTTKKEKAPEAVTSRAFQTLCHVNNTNFRSNYAKKTSVVPGGSTQKYCS